MSLYANQRSEITFTLSLRDGKSPVACRMYAGHARVVRYIATTDNTNLVDTGDSTTADGNATAGTRHTTCGSTGDADGPSRPRRINQ